uniref:BT1 family/Major Facilitator Superfamily, putative n=1 Tax=Theileria annulata TaxID=5874 RepID=A0A3B0MTG7_THEAN
MSSLDFEINSDTNPVKFDMDIKPKRFSLLPKSKRKLSILLIYMIGFSEGLLHLSNLAIYYMFKDDFGLSPAQMTLLYSIPAIPYVIRPAMAYLTDTIPIFGTRRRHYLILNSLIQSSSFLFMGLVPISLFFSTIELFLITFTLAFCMTIAEALVVENISDGTDNLSGFIGIKAFSALLVSYFSGSLLEKYPKQRLFLITSLFPLLITFFAYFMKEEKTDIVYQSHPLKDLTKFLKEPSIFHPCVFMFLVVITPGYEDAFLYYTIDVLGYSPSFMGVLRLIYGISIVLGIAVCRLFFKNTSIKKLLIWSTLIVNILYPFPALITSGLSKKLGIPDKPLVLCGGFLMEAIFEIQVMPFLTYTTRVTPKGLEASVFAAIMTIKSVGIFSCKLFTALTTFLFGIDNHKYEHLTSYILFCTTTAMAVMFYLTKVPNKEEMELFVTRQKMTQNADEKT